MLFDEDEVASVYVKVTGRARCIERADTDQVGVEGAVICVTHQEYQGHPSNLNGEFALFGPRGLLGGTLIAGSVGANGDQPFQVQVAKDGTAASPGRDRLLRRQAAQMPSTTGPPTERGFDLTGQVQGLLGTSVEVGPAEGVLAGQGTLPGG